jgi:hypothetical protein
MDRNTSYSNEFLAKLIFMCYITSSEGTVCILQTHFDIINRQLRICRKEVYQVRVIRQVRHYPRNGDLGTFHNWFPDHDCRIDGNTIFIEESSGLEDLVASYCFFYQREPIGGMFLESILAELMDQARGCPGRHN